jgi:hypothetical protein
MEIKDPHYRAHRWPSTRGWRFSGMLVWHSQLDYIKPCRKDDKVNSDNALASLYYFVFFNQLMLQSVILDTSASLLFLKHRLCQTAEPLSALQSKTCLIQNTRDPKKFFKLRTTSIIQNCLKILCNSLLKTFVLLLLVV